jgi:hypothetical protein
MAGFLFVGHDGHRDGGGLSTSWASQSHMTMWPMRHRLFHIVMAGLDPAIHVFDDSGKKDVDARVKPAHDG